MWKNRRWSRIEVIQNQVTNLEVVKMAKKQDQVVESPVLYRKFLPARVQRVELFREGLDRVSTWYFATRNNRNFYQLRDKFREENVKQVGNSLKP
jgi:hypothetical protein